MHLSLSEGEQRDYLGGVMHVIPSLYGTARDGDAVFSSAKVDENFKRGEIIGILRWLWNAPEIYFRTSRQI